MMIIHYTHKIYIQSTTIAMFYDLLTNTKDNTKKRRQFLLFHRGPLAPAASHSEAPLGKHFNEVLRVKTTMENGVILTLKPQRSLIKGK